MSVPTIGGPGYHIGVEEFEAFVSDEIGKVQLEGKNLVLIIPDDTRGCPMPRILRAVYKSVINRAASVRNYLTSRGISPSVISIDGRGEREPIASNATAEGRARNRRVEIFVGENTH